MVTFVYGDLKRCTLGYGAHFIYGEGGSELDAVGLSLAAGFILNMQALNVEHEAADLKDHQRQQDGIRRTTYHARESWRRAAGRLVSALEIAKSILGHTTRLARIEISC